MRIQQTRTRPGWVAALGVVVALTATSALLAPVASAAPGCSGSVAHRGDVDGDDRPDTVVGVPNAVDSQGVVHITPAAGGSVVVDSGVVGITPRAGDQFGRAVALADIDGDGCDDVVVGAPGAPGGGYVAVIPGAAEGVGEGGFVIANPGGEGDEFGHSLAVIEGWMSREVLWVGAPGADVDGLVDAGTVVQYSLRTEEGITTPLQIGRFSTPDAGLAVTAQAGERLGEVMAATVEGRELLLGVPRRDVDGARDAGAVFVLSPATAAHDGVSKVHDTRVLTQATPGFKTRPEAGDRFGAAVAGGHGRTVIGVPGEDVYRKPRKKELKGLSPRAKRKVRAKARRAALDVGAVQVLAGQRPLRFVTLDSRYAGRKVPGSASRRDHFGSAVVVAEGLTCSGLRSFAVGAPGEDVVVRKARKATKRKKARKAVVAKNAGAVIVLTDGSRAARCGPKRLVQGDGYPGKPQREDLLGTALAVVPDRLWRESADDRLLVGAPSESLGSDHPGAGVVTGYAEANLPAVDGDPVTGYGSVLASVIAGTPFPR